jgi:hypothetical protein
MVIEPMHSIQMLVQLVRTIVVVCHFETFPNGKYICSYATADLKGLKDIETIFHLVGGKAL